MNTYAVITNYLPGIVYTVITIIVPPLVYTEKTISESDKKEWHQLPERLSKQWKVLPGQLRKLTKEGKSGLSVVYSLGKNELVSLPSNVYRGSQLLYINTVAGAKAIYKFIKKNEDPKH